MTFASVALAVKIQHLLKICDEIFGEQNFVGCISRATGTTTGQDANKIGSSLDYCLVYSKSNLFSLNGLPLDEKDKKRFSESDDKGAFSMLQLRKTGNADTRQDRPKMFYPVTAPDGTDVYPFGPTNYLSRWRVGLETYNQLLQDNMIVWKKDDNSEIIEVDGFRKSQWTPYVKYYLEGRTKQVSNLFQEIEGNKKASIVLKELLGQKGIFDNPKPLEFLATLIQISSLNSSDLILDFFSGSATTAHAVMQLNADDGGNRRFIMVQLPELTDENSEAYKAGYKNICEIGKERIRRAGKKIKDELKAKNSDGGLFAEGGESKLDTGFRVLKLDSSNMEDVFYTPDKFEPTLLDGLLDNIKPDRSGEDLLFQVMLDLGIELSAKIERKEVAGKEVFSVDDDYLITCFDTDVDETVIEEMAKLLPTHLVIRDASASSDNVLDNFDQIVESYSNEKKINIHIL